MTQSPLRIELPFEPENGLVNVYLFTDPEPVLIDAGFNSERCWQTLSRELSKHRLCVEDLRRVIITHPHIDHYGLAARIAHNGQADVWMADVGVQWLSAYRTLWQRRIDFYRNHFWPTIGAPPSRAEASMEWMQLALNAWETIPAERIVSFPSDGELMLGGCAWQVLHMQGHDSHLTAFYQPETRQLLSSDQLMIPTATPVVEPPPTGNARIPCLPLFLQSLDRLAALDVETVYPGHGPPFGDHRQVIAGQIKRIHERKEECLRLIAQGHQQIFAIFEQLYGERIKQVGSAGLWMVVGYLDLLEAEGKVRVEKDGVWRYWVK